MKYCNNEAVPRRTVVLLSILAAPLVGHAAPSAEQTALVRQFRACLQQVAASKGGPYNSPCARANADPLVGLSRSELLDGLGIPDFCIDPQPAAQRER